MLIIWRGLVTYLDNNLRAGKSVNIVISAAVDLQSQRAERAHIHHLK